MDANRRSELIRRYEEGPSVLESVYAGLSQEQLDFRPAQDEWSPREIAHHTADSEMTSAIRLRRLLAEERPVIEGYDEAEFARRLHYSQRPVEPSLAAVRAARESTLSILRHLREEDWARAGDHSESGTYSVERWLEIYAAHCHDHADQARRVLAVGWPDRAQPAG